jgi:hypothetical protein
MNIGFFTHHNCMYLLPSIYLSEDLGEGILFTLNIVWFNKGIFIDF